MLRRKATIILFAAATLGACGLSPTAPSLPTQVAPVPRMSSSSLVEDLHERGSAVRSERRGRSKYSVIFF